MQQIPFVKSFDFVLMQSLVEAQLGLSTSIITALRNFRKDPYERKTSTYAKNRLVKLTHVWTQFQGNHAKINNLAETYPETPYLTNDTYKKTRAAFETLKDFLEDLQNNQEITSSSESESETDHLSDLQTKHQIAITPVSAPVPPPRNPSPKKSNSPTSPNQTLRLIPVGDVSSSSEDSSHEPVNQANIIEMSTSKIMELLNPISSSDSPEIFVLRAQKIYNLLLSDDERSLFATLICLKLDETVLKTLTEQQQESWDDIKSALLAKKPPTHIPSIESLHVKLSQQKQYSHENAHAFGTKISAIHSDLLSSYRVALKEAAVPPAYKPVIERQVVRAFEDGLRDESLKNLVMMHRSLSLADAISFAIEFENRTGNQSSKTSHHEYHRYPNTQGIICHRCQTPGHYANKCPKFTATKAQNENPQVSCTYCKQQGHHISSCEQRISNNMRIFGTADRPITTNSYQKPQEHFQQNAPRQNPPIPYATNTNQTYRNPVSHPSEPIASGSRQYPKINIITQENTPQNADTFNSNSSYPFYKTTGEQVPPDPEQNSSYRKTPNPFSQASGNSLLRDGN